MLVGIHLVAMLLSDVMSHRQTAQLFPLMRVIALLSWAVHVKLNVLILWYII